MNVSFSRTLVFTAIVCLFTATYSVSQNKFKDDGIGSPRFTTIGGVSTVPRTSKTIPHWSSSFTTAGVTYPFTMVGTDPSTTNVTTTVDTVIIPIKFVFADGHVLDGGSKVANITGSGNTLGSPNYQNAVYPSGDNTQFGDAIQRAEFNVFSTNPAWHTLIHNSGVFPTITIAVPANQGLVLIGRNSGALIGLMSASWFSAQFQNLIKSLHIPPTTLPIVQTYDTFLFVKTLSNCCVLGFHGAFNSVNGNGQQQVQTFIYAAWTEPGIFQGRAVQDVLPLSHEVSEWMNDPFLHNFVPPWQFPNGAGCQGNLETGDPVEVLFNSDFPVTVSGFTYHPQIEAILPWFSRQVPSLALDGAYSYPDTTTLTAPSNPCS